MAIKKMHWIRDGQPSCRQSRWEAMGYQLTANEDEVTCERCKSHAIVVRLLQDPATSEEQAKLFLKFQAVKKYTRKAY